MFEKLIEFLTGKCRFHKTCPLYYKAAFNCNHDAGPYCGKHRELIELEAQRTRIYSYISYLV